MSRISRRRIVQGLTAGLAAPYLVGVGRAQERTLNFYNWADYLGETTLADFEAATGIKPVFDAYDSAEIAEAKLLAGSSGYDVVVTASRLVPRLTQIGILSKIDKSKLPNYNKLDSAILAIAAKLDPGNEYAVPYMWGTTGITYNTEMVEALVPNPPYDSMDMIFNPEISSKLKSCGINMVDSPGSLMQMFLAYLGKDPLSESLEDLEEVVQTFAKIRENVRSFGNTAYTSQLANKELCMTTNWAGDYAFAINLAKEAGVNLPLRYEVPKSGGTMWLDMFVIPSDAKNISEAHEFLNYLMLPEVIAKATNYTAYANAIPESKPLLKPEILNNVAVYPDESVMKRIWLPKAVSPEYEAARVRAWTKIMTGG